MKKRYYAVLMTLIMGISVFLTAEPAYAIAKESRKSYHMITLFIEKDKVITYQWSR